MNQYKYIKETLAKGTGRITLNRPEVHNALNIEMIREISNSMIHLSKNESIRIITIDAEGKNFSAGADINWLKKGVKKSEKELISESKELAMLFNNIYISPKVTVVIAKGKVIGGANGIAASADITVATPETTFIFSEVKLGLIPATIAPYIIQKTGKNVAKEWMLTARTIHSAEAYERGFVNWMIKEDEISRKLQSLTMEILNNGPEAIKGLKQMFRELDFTKDPGELIEKTSKLIAAFRVSEEGQEGMNAFLEKRQPGWRYDKEKN